MNDEFENELADLNAAEKARALAREADFRQLAEMTWAFRCCLTDQGFSPRTAERLAGDWLNAALDVFVHNQTREDADED